MTFYSYGLSDYRSGSIVFTKSLVVASAESTVATIRQGAHPLPLSAANGQSIGPGPLGGSPFTSAFSPDFGYGQNYIIVSVGKRVHVSAAETIAFTKLKFGSNFRILSRASPQSVSLLPKHVAVQRLSILAASSVRLIFPRLQHAVVAAQQGISVGLLRSTRKILSATAASSTLTRRAISHLLSLSSPEVMSSTVRRAFIAGVGAVASASVTRLVNGTSKIFGTLSPSSTSSQRGGNRIFRIGEAQVAAILRALPVRLSALIAQSPRVGFGGNFFVRIFHIQELETSAVGRGLAITYHALISNTANAIKTPLKVLHAASTSAAMTVRTAGKVLGLASVVVAAARNQIGMARRVIQPALQQVLLGGAGFFRTFSATSSEVAAIFRIRARYQPLAVAQSEASSMVKSALRTIFQASSVAQASVASSVRGASRSFSTGMAALQSMARSMSVHLPTILPRNFAALTRLVGLRNYSITSPEAVASSRGAALARSVAEVAAVRLTHQRGLGLSAINAQVGFLYRLTSKIIRLAQTMVVASGRINSKILHAITPNVASHTAPFGFVFRTIQGQVAQIVEWYHLFVPDWAYQQTVLLPPDGGPAEPPAFGPIDPFDRTTFAFDWSSRADNDDPITSASVVSVPSGMNFIGPVFVNGTLVEVTAGPFTPPSLPAVYTLRCTAIFTSGRRNTFSIPVPVRML